MIEIKSDLVKEFKHWVFPGGEVGVKFEFNELQCNSVVVIDWKILYGEDWHKEFFIVANAINAIKEKFDNLVMVSLNIPYLPYSRQDRVCSSGEANSLKVFAGMVNSMSHDKLTTLDVHNEIVYTQLFDARANNVCQSACAKNLPQYDYLIAPDKGASKKISSHLQIMQSKANVVVMNKVRKDGIIVYNTMCSIPKGSRVCVVDDLSDGNGTFVALAGALNYKEFAAFDLYVTHGLFSKGLDNLRGVYNHVFCRNLMNQSILDDPLLTILN